jgi:hypothetical protein
MSFPALKEAAQKLEAKRKALGTVFDEAGPEMDFTQVKSIKGNPFEIAATVRQMNDEMTDLGKEYDNLLAVQRASEAVKTAGAGGSPGGERGDASRDGFMGKPSTKSFGEMFVASDAYRLKSGRQGPETTLDIDTKTLMTTAAGWTPEVDRTGRVVPSAQRPVQVADLIPQTTTSQAAVQYMEETTFTNAAAEILEAGNFPEAALALTERVVPVTKIAVFLPVTDEQLEDERLHRQPAAVHDPSEAGRPAAGRYRHLAAAAGHPHHGRHSDPGQGHRPGPGRHLQGDHQGGGDRPGPRQRCDHAPERLAGHPAASYGRRHLHLGQPVGRRPRADLGAVGGPCAGHHGEHGAGRRLRQLF